ncbi:hypothetical protein EA672_18635, partial [Acinetobacter baumannii]
RSGVRGSTPVPAESGRTGVGHSGVGGMANPVSKPGSVLTAEVIMIWQHCERKELAMHVHKLSAVTVKIYLDTT